MHTDTNWAFGHVWVGSAFGRMVIVVVSVCTSTLYGAGWLAPKLSLTLCVVWGDGVAVDSQPINLNLFLNLVSSNPSLELQYFRTFFKPFKFAQST